jgi:hypothetical protein
VFNVCARVGDGSPIAVLSCTGVAVCTFTGGAFVADGDDADVGVRIGVCDGDGAGVDVRIGVCDGGGAGVGVFIGAAVGIGGKYVVLLYFPS